MNTAHASTKFGLPFIYLMNYFLAFCKYVFLFLTMTTEGCDFLLISFISANSVLQLALIKVNNVQTLIINCAASCFPAMQAYSARGKYRTCQLGCHKKKTTVMKSKNQSFCNLRLYVITKQGILFYGIYMYFEHIVTNICLVSRNTHAK